MNGRPNARVYIETKPVDLEKLQLPEAPDLEKVLSIIWNIQLPNISTTGLLKNVPRLQVDPTTRSAHHIREILKSNHDGDS
jgi:hypothetical protein